MTANEIAFNPIDQGEIASAAPELYSEIKDKLPPIPWLSNSGQQEAFHATVKAISDAAELLPADRQAKCAITFWALVALYANNKKFRVATNAAKRVSGLMKIWAVELTFVEWIGSEMHPGMVVAAAMSKWMQAPSGIAGSNALQRDRTDRIISLRERALSSYDREWKAAKDQQNGDRGANQRALHAVLEGYMRDCPSVRAMLATALAGSTTDERAIDMVFQSIRPQLGLEMLPFSVVPVTQGRAAMIEYIVWREFPGSADEEFVRSTLVDAMSIIGRKSPELVADLKKSEFEWARLL